MKKILFSFCLLLSMLTISAQGNKTTKQPTQQDLDKALKDAQDLINKQDLPPEVKEYFKNSSVNPTNITQSIQIDKATMDAYKKQPKGIINTDTITDPDKEAEIRLASIGTTSTQKIGPEGGVVISKNGKIKLTIPKGALTKMTEIKIVESENKAPNGCGNSFNLLPEGLVFNKPAKITLKYTQNEINGTNPYALRILTKKDDGDYEVYMNTELDIYNKTITTDIPHFSVWGFGSMLKLKIEPNINKIIKGQKINLFVSGWDVKPKDKSSKSGKFVISSFEKLHDIYKKIYPNSTKETGMYSSGPGFYRVKEWTMDGNNPAESLIGTITTITKDLTGATYTAPKNISPSWMTRIVNIYVEMEENTDYEFAPLFKGSMKLLKRIEIIEEGEVIYSIDDNPNVKSIQLNGTEFAEYYSKLKPDEIPKISFSSCNLNKNILSISCDVTLPNDDSPASLFFSIKNPKLGENLLTCDGNKEGSVMLSQGKIGSYKKFEAQNINIKRQRDNGECKYQRTCQNILLKLYEFIPEVGGVVSGSFHGGIFQDGEKYEDACMSSDEHFLIVKFNLFLNQVTK